MSDFDDDAFKALTPVGDGQGRGDESTTSSSNMGEVDGWDGIDRGAPPIDPQDGQQDPPEKIAAEHPLNDYGNGLRLITHFGDDLLYVPRVGFFTWDHWRWLIDPDDIRVRRMAHALSDLIAKETWYITLPEADMQILAAAEEAKDEMQALSDIAAKDRSDEQVHRMAVLAKLRASADAVMEKREKSIARRLTHAKNAGNSNAIKNLMSEAAAIIARPIEDLDAGPLDINTLSGVLRFSVQPGEDEGGMNPPAPVAQWTLVPHDRSLLLSKLMPVEIDRRAICPTFDAFLRRVQPSAEMRRFLQRWFGLSMTGLTGEQKFAFLYGSGANGKSVLVDLMAKLMGDYAASAKIESITGKNRRGGGDATPDLMPLIGARFARASEPDDGQRLQEGLIKELTGGEPILVRALNQNFILVYPHFKLTISGNHKPEIHGGDDGIWRRVMLVPFDVQIPPDERDPDLLKKLWEERSGIMNWLIDGLVDYLANGLQVPEQVSSATQEYREDSDPMGAFLTICCSVTGEATDTIPAKQLSAAFNYWLDDAGRGTWSDQTVYKRLRSKAERWKSPTTGQTFRARKASSSFYEGVTFLEPFRSRWQNLPRDHEGNVVRGRTDGFV